MSFSKSLDRLVTQGEFPGPNRPKVRWGQLIRSNASLSEQQAALIATGRLRELDTLGVIRGGIVTRANAYFLVREIPFDQIPARMRVTRADLRLFDVKDDKKVLEKHHAHGALSYLRRGETINFKTSDDDLKGGIPAKRSQVKNRKPFWYSLQGEQRPMTRIVFPEHIDTRYVSTIVPEGDQSVVIDKLYLFEPYQQDATSVVHAALNSLLSWYQMELRGRSQLGEGVLELKIPDFAGILVLNPDKLTPKERRDLLAAFAELPSPGSAPSLSELGTPARHAFDLAYLKLCGFADAEATLLSLERGLRALAGERSERRLSVADAKVSRRQITNVAASIDAYATRIAASLDPHPDPRTFMQDGAAAETVSVLGEVAGPLDIGVELFNQGEVLAGGHCIARAGTVRAAQFVRGVLLIQPDLSQVAVPTAATLEKTFDDWTRASRLWHKQFAAAAQRAQVGIEDARTRAQIEQRALRLLHAI